MYRKGLVACAFALTLSACGGSSGDSSSAIDAGAETNDLSDGLTDELEDSDSGIQDDDSNLIPDGGDDLGTIPDIGDDLDENSGDDANPVDDDSVVDSVDSDELDSDDMADVNDQGSDIDQPAPLVTGSTARVDRWRAALAQEPSADVADRGDMIATLFELSRYDFAFEIPDLVADIEQRLTDGDAAFEPVNVTINGFERIHLCSGSGRVLSTNTSAEGLQNTVYSFESCAFEDQELVGSFILSERMDSRNQIITTSITSALTSKKGPLVRQLGGLIIQQASVNSGDGSFSSGFSGSYAESLVTAEALGDIDEESVSTFSISYNTHVHTFLDPAVTTDEDAGFVLLSRFEVTVDEESPEWRLFDFGQVGLRGESPEEVVLGQLTLDTDTADNASIVLQADNGDPDSFDLIGFSDDDTVGSAVYRWDDELRVGSPRLYSRR